MRKLLVVALFLFIPIVKADHNLAIIDKHVSYNSEDWQLAAQSNLYSLFIHKKSLNTGDLVVEMTSMVEFHNLDGYKYKAMSENTKRIYTYGIIECKNGLLNLMNGWYVDKTDKIIYTEDHLVIEYQVDLREPNTPRNDLYKLVCPNR
jgi:hypothetical protein